MTEIGCGAFYGCTSLISATIPNSVTKIEDDIFRDCTCLTSITIPSSVTEIGYRAFYGCTSLTSVTIPNSVTKIVCEIFRDCTCLTSITIPNSVTEIDGEAFYGCTSLTSVYCYAEKVPITEYNPFYGVPLSSATLHVPATSLEAYKTSEPWRKFGNIVALTDEEMDVKPIDNDESSINDVYDLSGRQQTKLKKGINIVRMSNGTIRKFMIR